MKYLSIAACFALMHAGAAMAAPAITYDCDTAASHFSELVLPTPAGSFTVTGQLQVNQLPLFDKFAPITRLMVVPGNIAPGSSAADLAGFSLNALPAKMVDKSVKDDKLMLQFVNWNATHDHKAEDFKPFGFAKAGDKLPFTLTYDGAAVTLSVAGEKTSIPLIVADPMVRIVCSTGEFLYTDLRIEKAS